MKRLEEDGCAPCEPDRAEEEPTVRMPRGRIGAPLQFLTGGYASWLDTRQAELEGHTPREAVANRVGRSRVEAILRELERKERTSALSAFHLDEVRRELGLEPRGRDWASAVEQTPT